MEYRQLGDSGFKVPALSLGTGTFGGGGEFFKAWGASDVAEATRLVDVCLEAGLTMFDSADIYSDGLAEEILGQAIKGRRDQVLISTKGDLPRRAGAQRRRLVALSPDRGGRGAACGGWGPTTSTSTSCTPSTRMTPVEETLRHARRPGPGGQDPLHRLLQLLGLAPDEVAGGLGEVRPVRATSPTRPTTRWSAAITSGS